MSRCKVAAVLVAFALAGCGSHVAVSANDCAIEGTAFSARLTNGGSVPLVQAEIVADYYRNYKFTRGIAEAVLKPVLDPGTSRVVKVDLAIPGIDRGAPMRCTVTRAEFGDGTAQGESLRP